MANALPEMGYTDHTFYPFSKILDSPLLSGYDSRQAFVTQAWQTVPCRWNAKYAVCSLGSWI